MRRDEQEVMKQSQTKHSHMLIMEQEKKPTRVGIVDSQRADSDLSTAGSNGCETPMSSSHSSMPNIDRQEEKLKLLLSRINGSGQVRTSQAS